MPRRQIFPFIEPLAAKHKDIKSNFPYKNNQRSKKNLA